MILKKWLIITCSIFVLSAFSQKQDSLVMLLEKEQSPQERVELLLAISIEYFYTNQTKYQFYAKEAHDLYKQHDLQNDTLEAKILFEIGCSFCFVNDTTSCFYYFHQAETIAEKYHNTTLLSQINGEKGMAYGSLGVSDKAILHYQKSLRIAEANNDSIGISMNANNIGLIFLDLKEFDQAKIYFQKNYDISKSQNDIHGCAISFSNMGSIALEQKKYDKALAYFKNALNIVDSLGLTYGIMLCNMNIGRVYFGKNLIEGALKHQEIAYGLAQKAGFPEQATCALEMALIKFKQKNYITSIEKAKEAIELGEGVLDKKQMSEMYKCLIDNYKALREYEEALHYYELYETARDSSFNQQRIKTFAEMEYRFQNDKKETENQYLKAEQLKNQTIIKQRTIIAIGVAIGLLLLIILVLILWQKNKQKRQYNKQLETRVKERTVHLEESNQKLKAANVELERFAYITSHDLKEPLRNISSFAGLIRRKIKQKKYDDLEDYSHFIIKSASQMNHLIQDVLEFSMIDKNSKDQKYINLTEMLNKIKIDLHLLITEKRAHIVYPPSAYIIHVPIQLSLVFKNLIENGIKYNQSLNPVIKITYQKHKTQQVFLIEDNGIGIPAAYQEQIFEMFKRLHNRADYEGSGIGLAICKKIIEHLKGELLVNSQVGKGTVFELRIPIETMEAIEI